MPIIFERPYLIYDNYCYACYKFASLMKFFSRNRIQILGHYNSEKSSKIKKMIFPSDYDSTKMFWLINKHGAWGARAGLIPLFKEILYGNIRPLSDKPSDIVEPDYLKKDCENNRSCKLNANIILRLFNLFKNSAKFYHIN